ncbi:MAG: ribbon-helix-helix protein, CopG family [Xanthomonadaceae bacterium]|nr:ribbon-helix-helix protein, CopG family [Xanthomonadaceae bacterium]
MVTPTIKSTYSLDPRTVRDLERLARRFGTSKSEVLRRAVQSLASQETPPEANGLQALEELQKSCALTEARAKDWAAQVRRERATMGRGRVDD